MSKYHQVDFVAQAVKTKLQSEGSGHDWWHIVRVVELAKRIGRAERANLFIVELAAFLHDIADWKFHNGDENIGPKTAKDIMCRSNVPVPIIEAVCEIISTVSYKGAGVPTPMKTLEGKVVQDADRLDAIGAIGIGRAFAYGGHKNRLLHDPHQKPRMHKSKEEYFNNQSTTINHFYEKLLLLKDLMNTVTGKHIAEERHQFMVEFLKRFEGEWNGKL